MTSWEREGIVWILSAPSGTGKSSITKRLMAQDPTLHLSVSYTTRAPRKTEKDGEHYYFCTEEKFKEMRQQNAFLESAQVFGNYYGTPKKEVRAHISKGEDILCDIDWQGATSIAEHIPLNTVRIFIMPPSMDALYERLHARGEDDDVTIKKRLEEVPKELAHMHTYDYVVCNAILDDVVKDITSIICAERLKRSRFNNIDESIRNFLIR